MTNMDLIYQDINVNALIAIAEEAGRAIMKIYGKDFSVETKDDKSPLTEADKKSNEVILAGLTKAHPAIPYISEETKLTPYKERKNWSRLWLIDPLDGTKEFIKKNGEFTVNIALIEAGVPVVGIVNVPAQNVTYVGVKGGGAFKVDHSGTYTSLPLINDSDKDPDKVIVVASRSHLSQETERYVDGIRARGVEVEFRSSGSSLKFCLVAEGVADVYPRFAPTMEWDTAAAHAVVLYSGKSVTDVENNRPLQYNKESLLNPWFVAE